MDDNKQNESDPGINSVFEFLTYSISLPERALRSTSAMVGGVLRESASLLVPQAFRDSKSYHMFVDQMLDFVANDIGGVKSDKSSSETAVDGYVAKKTVSNFVELAGMAMLHVSPLTVLAITSDLAHGSTVLLKELSVELKKQGVIPEESTIDSTAQLLEAVGKTSGDVAGAFDLPPLSVEGLRDTIAKTTEQVANLDPTLLLPQAEIERLWNDMHEMATEQNVDVFDISSAMTMYAVNQLGAAAQGTLTTIRVTHEMFEKHIFDHYWSALEGIGEQGIYGFISNVSEPYIEAVWHNFSFERETITQDILSGKLVGQVWEGFQGWIFGSDKEDQTESETVDNSSTRMTEQDENAHG